MYMTRLDVERGSRTAADLLGNAQKMHAEVCHLAASSRRDSNLLYRVADSSVYVSSDGPLDIKRARPGIRLGATRDLSEWIDQFTEGDVFRFDLLAAPACKKARDGFKNSQRVTIDDPEARMNWLMRQAEKHGFEIIGVEERGGDTVSGYQPKRGKRFKLRGYRYIGVLRITNPEKFRAAIREGIGPEKAYGFGMLMVIPA